MKAGDKRTAFLLGISRVAKIYKVSIGFKDLRVAEDAELDFGIRNAKGLACHADAVPDILFTTVSGQAEAEHVVVYKPNNSIIKRLKADASSALDLRVFLF